MKASAVYNFASALVAILAGNVVYLLLTPHLPPAWRHQIFQIDLGLAVDFCICFALFLIIKRLIARSSRPDRG